MIRRTAIFRATWAFLLLGCLSRPSDAAVRLSPPFGDQMVLQRDQAVPVWGAAAPGEQVTVEFGGQKKTAKADTNGNWRITLDALRASSEPRDLAVQAAGDPRPLTLHGVLVGEVWLASGQSNMELPVRDAADATQEIARADYPQIRMLTVAHAAVPKPAASVRGEWASCSPATAGAFSAVGYYFAREIHTRLKVPVGIINASWGGSPAQPWTPWETARSVSAMRPRLDALERAHTLWMADKAAYQKQTQADAARLAEDRQRWTRALIDEDIGQRQRWFEPATGTSGWQRIELPMASVAEAMNYMGSFWFRRDVDIPQAWVGKKLVLNLGAIDDGDVTWVNGREVGRTLYEAPNGWRTPRHYDVPADVVATSRVAIVIQAVNHVFSMGVGGTAKDMSLALADEPTAPPVSLAATWLGRVGTEVDVTAQPVGYGTPWPEQAGGDIGGMYNAMIAPLAGYAMRGALWYQGESNANEPAVYAELFPALIRGWRAAWQREFPFYFVQLAGFCARQRDAVERGSWAELREAQRAALALPNTGMAVATDIGDAADIHPKNKQEVGRRLALWALANDYRQKLECSGPLYRAMKIEGGSIRLTFDHGRGLRPAAGQLTDFAIAGVDKTFHWARATIDRQSVVVSSDRVPKPVAVRYAWAFNPMANLENGAGLPAASFRTDDWPSSEILVAVEPAAP